MKFEYQIQEIVNRINDKYRLHLSVYEKEALDDILVDISATPPTYTLFGIQTAAVFNGFKKSKIKLELNVDNVFNIAYREHLNRLRYFADDLGRNINFKININY